MGTKKFASNQVQNAKKEIQVPVKIAKKVTVNDQSKIKGGFTCPWSNVQGRQSHLLVGEVKFKVSRHIPKEEITQNKKIQSVKPVVQLKCPTCLQNIIYDEMQWSAKDY